MSLPRPRYLVGLDPSPAGEAALRFAGALAEPVGASLEAVRGVPVVPLAVEMYGDEALEDRVIEEAGRLARDLVAAAGLTAPARAAAGDPAAVLCEQAAEREASLIVVGSTHRGRFGRVLPGSVAERAIHGAPCSVCIVPVGDAPMPRRIAVAYDGRAEAEHALEAAAELTRALGGELTLVGVDEPIYGGATVSGTVLLEERRRQREAIEHRLEERRAGLEPGLHASVELLHGIAGPALEGFCAGDVDLLVCGSRGFGPLHAALAGSTSRHLADRAPCPVIVVPRGGARSLVWAAGPSATPVAT